MFPDGKWTDGKYTDTATTTKTSTVTKVSDPLEMTVWVILLGKPLGPAEV